MTEVISYAREKRPKALTPLYIVYVVSYTFNVYDQAGNMYTYNLYIVSYALNRYTLLLLPLSSCALCAYYVFMRACVFWKISSITYTMYKFPCTFSHLYVARSCV